MKKQLSIIIERMENDNIDVAFFSNPSTVSYLTGYQSDPHERILALIVLKNGGPFLFTPALEEEDAKRIVEDISVFSYLDTENPWQVIRLKLDELRATTLSFGIEKNHLTVARKEALSEYFPESNMDYDFSSFIEHMRLTKTTQEIELMKESGYWADEALRTGMLALKEGVTEIEVVAEIEYEMKKRGISAMSFDTMVLFGKNAASPHGVPGKTKLEKNQFVLFDLGVMYKGYASDVTRTVYFGSNPSHHERNIYQLVLKSHDEAMKQAQLGMTANELDHVARSLIANEGYGDHFNHRLGHGLGQGVHEFPSLMEGNELALTKNMCFSIEPGIYLVDDIGVRIEDCGFLDEKGFHSFTFFPTNLTAYADFIKE